MPSGDDAEPPQTWVRRLLRWLFVSSALAAPMTPPVDLVAALRAAGYLPTPRSIVDWDAELRALVTQLRTDPDA